MAVAFEATFPSDLSEWDSEDDTSGSLAWTNSVGLAGLGVSMHFDFDNAAGTNGFVVATTSVSGMTDHNYAFRFYMKSDGCDLGTGADSYLVLWLRNSSNETCLRLRHRNDNTVDQKFRVELFDDGGSANNTSYYTPASFTEYYIDVVVTQASNATANDGTLAFYIDGSLQETMTGLDIHDKGAVSEIRFGGANAVAAAFTGDAYYGAFRMDNVNTVIGAYVAPALGLTPPGVNHPKLNRLLRM